MNNKPIYPISVLSNLLNVHQRSLRIYDELGILSPKRNNKNRRMYSQNDLEKAKLILYLTRNLALNMMGVRLILAMIENKEIEPKDYISFVKTLVEKININEEDNVIKTARRGRKPKAQQN
ncbi:MAG: MerR family transcriptional regulator [Candidatus Gastranaerophilales bacterium]|nr:MerR family transcriptional regulator [Candidatus Gastranaerophilales bacterium]